MIIFEATAVCFPLKIGNMDFRFAAERRVSGVYASMWTFEWWGQIKKYKSYGVACCSMRLEDDWLYRTKKHKMDDLLDRFVSVTLIKDSASLFFSVSLLSLLLSFVWEMATWAAECWWYNKVKQSSTLCKWVVMQCYNYHILTLRVQTPP